MASVSEMVRQNRRPRWTAGVAAFLVLAAGCVGLETNPLNPNAPPAPGKPCQVVTTWQPQIYYTADPTRGGVEAPTLVGRVYLFDEEIKYPMTGDGVLMVSLYEGTVAPGTDPVPLEVWKFDPDSLRRLLRHDAVGWGYTIPLVWGTYRPDISRVQLKVCYQPATGTPLYAESSSMAIGVPAAADGPVITQSAKPRGP